MNLKNSFARFVFLTGCFSCGFAVGGGIVMVLLGQEFPTLIVALLVAVTTIQYMANKAVENVGQD